MTITKGTKYITDPNTIPINTSFANDVLPTLLNTLNTNTSNHIGSTSAHSSTDITYDNTSSGLTATNTKAAIDEIDVNNEATQTQLNSHETSTSAHASVDITYDNTISGLTSTNVKTAVDEVKSNNDSTQTQLDNHEASTTAHDAADIVYSNTSSGLTATTSQAAIDEVESRVDTVEANKVDSNSEASLLNIAKEEITTATTGSLDLDVSTASSFLVDVVGTIDITLSGTTTDKTHQVYVEALNSGGSLSWTTSITWDAGTEPTLGTNFTIYYLVYIGGTWYGKAIISN